MTDKRKVGNGKQVGRREVRRMIRRKTGREEAWRGTGMEGR